MSTIAPLCPTCRTALPGGVLTGICAVCAWQELELEAAESARATPADALFVVPGHDVLAELGRGGGGLVYRARQHQPKREVALKMLPPALLGSPDLQARFRMEAETIATLDHPAILPIYTVGEKDGLPYFTMKLATRGTLAARREALRGRWREIAELVVTLAGAVQHAHTHGVVHRDLKPGNVLFDDEDRAYVSDFGLAKFTTAEPSVTRSLVVLGTPAYLAPEVVVAGASAATTGSDVYGLGALLYELLAGRPPFAGENIPELLRQIAGDEPTPPSRHQPGVPRDLEVIALRCLAKEPARRLSSAAALAEDLTRWLEHRPILARPVPPVERVAQWTRRNPALATLSALLVLGLVGGGAALVAANRDLREALRKTAAAEKTSEERLHRSLLDQARLLRSSGLVGQRHEALEAITRAAAIARSTEVRSEAAAALARADLKLERSLPAFFLDRDATVAFAPDFQSYLSYSGRGDFVTVSVEGKVLRRFKPAGDDRARHFGFSDDGHRLTATFLDGRTEVWSITGEAPLWTAPKQAAVALHPTSGVVAWSGEDGAIQLRTLEPAAERRLVTEGARIMRLRFSPDGATVAATRAAQLTVYDANSGQPRWTRAGAWSVTEPAWSPDRRWLAAADTQGSVVVLDAHTGAVVQTLGMGSSFARFLVFRPESSRLAALTSDAVLRVWEIPGGEPVLQMALPTRTLAFSPDGRQMAGALRWLGLGLYTWTEAAGFKELRGQGIRKRRGDGLDVSADGQWVATCDTQEVRIWDVATGEQAAAFALPKADWTSVRFHPSGGRLVYSGMESGVWQRSYTVETDAASHRRAFRLGEPEPLGEARDGRLLGLSANGRDWFIHRGKTGQVVAWPEGDWRRETVLAPAAAGDRPAVSADGKWVITMGGSVAQVRVTAVGSGRETVTLPLQQHAGASFSPDGRWVVTGTDAEYQRWSLPGLKPEPSWPGQIDGGWGTSVFSPDGHWLSLEGQHGSLEVRDAQTFDRSIVLTPPHRLVVEGAAWSADGNQLFVLGAGHRLFAWNLAEIRRELAARNLE